MAKDFSINSRIESKIHRILSETIIHEIKDHRLKDVSINEVQLSSDLGYAKVFCSSLNLKKSNVIELLENLTKASGIFKKNISKKVSLKKIPQLNFVFDEHEKYANDLTNLIDQAIKNDKEE